MANGSVVGPLIISGRGVFFGVFSPYFTVFLRHWKLEVGVWGVGGNL